MKKGETMKNNIDELKKKLLRVYDETTVHPNWRDGWSIDNPTYGQCVPTSLLVQNLFGGEIYKLEQDSHYYNVIKDKIVDLTKEQFNYELDYSKGVKRTKPFEEESIERYELLKKKVDELTK